MADVASTNFDTSSYLKPSSNVGGGNILSNAGGYGALAAQATQLSAQKLALAQSHFQALNQNLGAALSAPEVQPQNVSANPQAALNFVQGQVQNMYKMGLLTSDQVAQEQSQLPTLQQLQQDPTALQGHLNLALNRTASNQENFQRQYGSPTQQNNGAGIISGVTNAKTGAFNPASNTPAQPGPGVTTINQPEIGSDGKPTGRVVPTAVSNADIYRRTAYPNGQPPLVQPIGPGGPAPAAPQAPAAPTAPAQPQAAAPASPAASAPAQPAQVASAAPVGTQSGTLPGVAVGLPVGAQGAIEGSAKAGVDAETAFNNQISGSQMRKAQIANIGTSLDKVSTGPLANVIHTYGATLNQAGQMVAGTNVVPPESISAYEEGVKAATQLAQTQAQALGSSVAALGSAGHTVPDFAHNSTLGNKRIAAVLNGNEDALQDMGKAWGDYKKANPGANFNDWQRDTFLPTFDPRAYQFMHMDPEARKDILATMPKTLAGPNNTQVPNPAYANFINSLNKAAASAKARGDTVK